MSSTDLIALLVAGDKARDLAFVGADGNDLVVFAGCDPDRKRTYPPVDMQSWLVGFTLGQQTANLQTPKKPPTTPDLSALRAVLVDVTLHDQMRIAIRWAMEAAGLNITTLAERVGRTAQAVTNSLTYGRVALTPDMAGRLMDGCGGSWDVRAVRPATPTGPTGTGGGGTPRPEPAGVGRIRSLVGLHDAGVLRLLDPLTPMRAQMPDTHFTVTRGQFRISVPARTALAWMTGLCDAVNPPALALIAQPGRKLPRRRRAAGVQIRPIGE